MGIVLLEPPHSCEAAQRTTSLIPVQDTEVSKTQRQLLVTPFLSQTVSDSQYRYEGGLLTLWRNIIAWAMNLLGSSSI